MRAHAIVVAAVVGVLSAAPGIGQAVVYQHHVYLDTDNNTSTGCAVDVHELDWTGQVTGVEQDVTIHVEQTASPQVVQITRAACSGGVWQAPVEVSPGSWPVGLGVGAGGADVIEGFVPRADVGAGPAVRLYFHSQVAPDNDVLLLSEGQQGQPMVLVLQTAEPVPAPGPVGLGLLAVAVAALAFAALRKRLPAAAALFLAAAVGMGSAATAWAATIAMDGQVADWQGTAPLGVDPVGDSSTGDAAEDIVAGFATFDAANLYFRVDVANAEPAQSRTFDFTGGEQSFVVPPGVTSITMEVSGAQGGANWASNTNFGGRVTATVPVTAGETLLVYVGGQPTGTAAGFNGGGAGDTGGAGGGGASDVRRGPGALADRIVVGGGGGGAGYWSDQHVVGGVGGGTAGGDGYRDPSYATAPGGLGASQSAGGADGTCIYEHVTSLAGGFGQGGTPSGYDCGCEGYGGGGGWYGGAGSGNCRGGGGGSAYAIAGATNVAYDAGVRVGNGQVIFTW